MRRVALLFSAVGLASAAALRAQDERPRIPQLQPPPPLDPRYLQRFQGTIETAVEDVSFRTNIGQLVSFERLEIVMDPEALGTDVVHARLIRIVRPSFVSPVDTISTPFDPFAEIPGPRTVVDRLVIEDGMFGAHAHPSQYEGRWLWRAQGVDVEARDITAGGTALSGRLVSANASAELKGRSILLRDASARVQRTAGVLDVDADVSLAGSDIAVRGTMNSGGGFRADVRTSPLAFADASAFVSRLPAEGTAVIDATIAGGDAPLAVTLRQFLARWRSSSLSASGDVGTGDRGIVRDLVIDVHRLAAADVDTLFGVSIPGDGVWSGGIRADGPLATGVAIAGALERTANTRRSTNGSPPAGPALPRIGLEGTLRTEPETAVALDVSAARIPVRDGIAAAEVRISGPLDSLDIGGTVRAGGIGAAEEITGRIAALMLQPSSGEARHLSGTVDLAASIVSESAAPVRAVTAHAEGTAVLADGGPVNARVVSDPVPLALLPLPSALDSVRGEARADLAITGTVDSPVLAGTLEVRGGAFRLPAARLNVTELEGPIVVRDGVADLGGLAARANGGTVDLDGTVRLLGGERTADVTLVANDIVLVANDSVRVLAQANVGARGALVEPVVSTDARLTLARPTGLLSLASLRGTVDVARDGALDFVLSADSLPLDALPVPSGLRGLRGGVAGSLRIGGTLDEPRADGRFDLREAGFTVVRTGTALRDLSGAAVVHEGVLTLEGVHGTVGGGALTMEGQIRIEGGKRTLDGRLTVDRGRVADTDSMQIVASADITATGELTTPAIGGAVTLHDGWVHEDNFARTPPIDTSSPPYDELIERVPWIANSRLRTGAAQAIATEPPRQPELRVVQAEQSAGVAQAMEKDEGPPLSARVRVDIERGLRLIDEDSEIHGNGTIVLIADSAGVRTEGLYRMTGGYYAQYGSVFEIRGGAFLFAGEGVSPVVTMRSEHRYEAPLGSWLTPGAHIMDRFPPLHFFALGTRESAGEEVRRMSLLPESRTELGALLLYNEEPQPVTGTRTLSFWAPDDGGALFGESSATRGMVLLANYIANESYDYLPLQRAYMRAGIIDVGPSRPGRITIGPYLQGGLYVGALHATVTQPVEGGTAPGIRLRYRLGAPELLAFSEPRFLSTAPMFPGGTVFTHGRRTGVGLKWVWEW